MHQNFILHTYVQDLPGILLLTVQVFDLQVDLCAGLQCLLEGFLQPIGPTKGSDSGRNVTKTPGLSPVTFWCHLPPVSTPHQSKNPLAARLLRAKPLF